MKKVGDSRSLLQAQINESNIPFSASAHIERLAAAAPEIGLDSETAHDASFGAHAMKRCKVTSRAIPMQEVTTAAGTNAVSTLGNYPLDVAL